MEKLTIGFSKSRKKFAIYSWIIRLVEGTDFSHVYVKWHSSSLERNITYQASGTTVNFMAQQIFNEHHIPVHEIELTLTADQKKEIVQFAMDNVGVPYGLKAAFGILLVKTASIFGKSIKNPFRDGGGTYFCSELAAKILEILGYDLGNDIEHFGPGELFEYMKRNIKP